MTELMRDPLARVQQEQKIETCTPVKPIAAVSILAAVALLAILGGTVLNALGQDTDKYSLKSPDGIAFSDFRGYEDWSTVSSARQAEVLKVIVANSAMIKAFKAGVPLNGKAFPEGSMIVKLQWLNCGLDIEHPSHRMPSVKVGFDVASKETHLEPGR